MSTAPKTLATDDMGGSRRLESFQTSAVKRLAPGRVKEVVGAPRADSMAGAVIREVLSVSRDLEKVGSRHASVHAGLVVALTVLPRRGRAHRHGGDRHAFSRARWCARTAGTYACVSR
mgnify:CR=1 FL=1